MLLFAVLMVVPVGMFATVPGAGAAVTHYTDPTITGGFGIAAGPDGALWFANGVPGPAASTTDSIGRISTTGAVTSYPDPSINGVGGLVAGPDGAMWFTSGTIDFSCAHSAIGRITTSGDITMFTDPGICGPYGIAVGSDGALWFANFAKSSIGRITTDGVVTIFTDPTITSPTNIVAGPDGALWFTNSHVFAGGVPSIGRITTSGVVTSFTDARLSDPIGIAAGPDGALWFTNNGFANGVPAVGRITTGGDVTVFGDPTINSPGGIVAGPDGAMWFTNGFTGSIGRITTGGLVTYYADPSSAGRTPYYIAAGSDGALWFNTSGGIGRITVDTPPTSGSCGGPCDVLAVTPGAPASSDSASSGFSRAASGTGFVPHAGVPTDAHPTAQIVTLPPTPGIPADAAGVVTWPVAFLSITPGPTLSPADASLCPPTGSTCVGQISYLAGDYRVFANKADPIQLQINAKWQTKVPAGNLFMSDGNGGPPVQLAKCVLKDGLYNTPCMKPEIVTGTAAAHNLITHDTVLFVGIAPHVVRRVVPVPGSPTAVKAIAANGRASVTWKAPVVTNGKISGYTITPRLGKVAQRATTIAGSARKATIKGLKNGKTYRFSVSATNAVGTGAASKLSASVTVGAPAQPKQPIAIKVASGSLKVTFIAPVSNGAPIKSYSVTCKSSNHGATKTNTGKGSPITVTGLTQSKTYTCTIKGTNARGTGPASGASKAVSA